MIGITATQPGGFLICCVLGQIMGILYAILTPIRRRRNRAAAVFVMDLLFWIIAAGVFLYGLYAATGGAFRVFCVAAYLLGYFIALIGPGYYIIKGEERILRWLDKKKEEARRNRMGPSDGESQ